MPRARTSPSTGPSTGSSTRSPRFARSLLPALLAVSALPAIAGLYPPAAPPGSAFIRVFNASNQPSVTAQVGTKNIPGTAALQASSYVFLAPGAYPLKVGGASDQVSLQGSRCYTAALGSDGKLHLFDEDCFNSQLKSLIEVYNLIDGTQLSVHTADGASVIDHVAAGRAGQREVNPVKASLAVYDGTTKLADAKPLTLERGKTYSLFVTGTRSAPVLIWVTG